MGKSLAVAAAKGLIAEWLDSFAVRMSEDLLLRRNRSYLPTARSRHQAFVKDLREAWAGSIDNMLILSHVAADLAVWLADARPKDARTQTLVGLHSRSVRTFSEVFCLFNGGHGGGMYGRWRTLLELSAVARIIADNGNELAQRYIDYGSIEVERQLSMLTGSSDAEDRQFRADAAREADASRRKWGPGFGSDLGWAIPVLGEKPGRRRRLLEQVPDPPHGSQIVMAHVAIHVSPGGAPHYIGSNGVVGLLGGVQGLRMPAILAISTLSSLTSTVLEGVEKVGSDEEMLLVIVAGAFSNLCGEVIADFLPRRIMREM